MSILPSVIHLSVCFSFPDDNLSKHQWIFTKLGMCIDIADLGLLMDKFCQIVAELSAHNTIMAGYYSLTFLLGNDLKTMDTLSR